MKKELEKLINKWESDKAEYESKLNGDNIPNDVECTWMGIKSALSVCLNDLKKLNEAIVSKEVFIDFMEWMRKYDFIDQVNMDELIVDEYLKSIKQRSANNS